MSAARRERVLAELDPERRAAGAGPGPRPGDTTVVVAVDGDRQGVTLIQSNASDFGAHLVEPATGTFLHNRGIGFRLLAGHPAEYGAGRRPPHTLSPALVTGPDGRLPGSGRDDGGRQPAAGRAAGVGSLAGGRPGAGPGDLGPSGGARRLGRERRVLALGRRPTAWWSRTTRPQAGWTASRSGATTSWCATATAPGSAMPTSSRSATTACSRRGRPPGGDRSGGGALRPRIRRQRRRCGGGGGRCRRRPGPRPRGQRRCRSSDRCRNRCGRVPRRCR